jgi:hypothetical protein
MRRTLVIAASAGLAAAAFVAPRAAAQEPQPGSGTIRGIVYDSLLRSPLSGAYVVVLHTSRSTLSDQRGHYVLDSVPAGRQIVSFSRPDLDSIGLSSFAARVVVEPDRETTLALAVPSHDTYWRAACGAPRNRAAGDSGLVFGTVTDAETRTRLAGARVTVTWITADRDRAGHILIDHPSVTVPSDSLGSYYVCGAPVEYLVTSRASAGPFSSGLAEVLVDIRGIARRDLSLSREVVTGGADSTAPSQRRGLATVVGNVVGERGGALPQVVATLDDVEGSAETDSAGRFVLRGLPSGTRMLMVRRVGYFASRQPLDLRNRDTAWVAVALQEATMLDTIRVTASPRLAATVEEIDLRRRTGFGYFLGPSQIRQRVGTQALFEGLPSMQTERQGSNNWIILMRGIHGYCQPNLYIDGFPSIIDQLATMQPRNLIAVEVYPRPTAALGRYGGFNDCGVVLVWTTASG